MRLTENAAAVTSVSPFRVGQRVWTTVTVAGTIRRMAMGIVVGIQSGYCDVDVMSLHGGAPWIQKHSDTSLEAISHAISEIE